MVPFHQVKHRVTYKMAALMFKMMFSSTPAYLNDLIQTAVPVRPLRSSDAPRTRTEFSSSVGFFWSRLRTLGTYYHPTLDPAILWTPSNDTLRPICSDSLNRCYKHLCIFGLYGALQMLLLLVSRGPGNEYL